MAKNNKNFLKNPKEHFKSTGVTVSWRGRISAPLRDDFLHGVLKVARF